jgi:hypothetical protein
VASGAPAELDPYRTKLLGVTDVLRKFSPFFMKIRSYWSPLAGRREMFMTL